MLVNWHPLCLLQGALQQHHDEGPVEHSGDYAQPSFLAVVAGRHNTHIEILVPRNA